MSAKLKAEGHKIVASMDSLGYSVRDKEWRHVANLVTARPDLTGWYVVKGDRPLGTKSTRMCIASKGKNLEINDHRNNGMPTVTRYRFDRTQALKCERVREAFGKDEKCREHYELVGHLGKEFGERIALQGEAAGGVLITILADPNSNKNEIEGDRDYRMIATTPEGSAVIASSGVRFVISEWILSAINKQEFSQ